LQFKFLVLIKIMRTQVSERLIFLALILMVNEGLPTIVMLKELFQVLSINFLVLLMYKHQELSQRSRQFNCNNAIITLNLLSGKDQVDVENKENAEKTLDNNHVEPMVETSFMFSLGQDIVNNEITSRLYNTHISLQDSLMMLYGFWLVFRLWRL
jgi:hypothetical protein